MLFWNRWNQESAGRVYFNISREKPAHTPDTPHVHTLSYKLEWTNQKHFYCFLLKPIRDNLPPGFPRALDLSPLHAQKSSGSRLGFSQVLLREWPIKGVLGNSTCHQLPSLEKLFSPLEWNYMTIESLHFLIKVKVVGRGVGIQVMMMMMMMLMGLSRVQFGLYKVCWAKCARKV